MPVRRASSASTVPTSVSTSSDHVLASTVALGSRLVGSPPLCDRPFTPLGPSDTRTGARPMDSSPVSAKKDAPVSSRTLPGRSSFAMRSSWAEVTGAL